MNDLQIRLGKIKKRFEEVIALKEEISTVTFSNFFMDDLKDNKFEPSLIEIFGKAFQVVALKPYLSPKIKFLELFEVMDRYLENWNLS